MLGVRAWLCAIAVFPAAWCGAGEFTETVHPIFMERCAACHGGVRQNGGFSIVYRDSVLGKGASGKTIVVPGDPDASELMQRVSASDPEDRMPPPGHGGPLSPENLAAVRAWIADGAKWEEHWAYVKPQMPELPAVQREDWVRRPLDRFILARLEKEGLEPAPEAGRAAWLRRVSFDLTGLPPTPEETAAFVADTAPEAYDRVVNRLLASPRYGERWAAMWLDFARYADSAGYEKDMHRNVWAYRDWVIRAFNDDMPFDTFTIKQLAGDLLPDPTLDDYIATVFHRNTTTNVEGGTDDEEFRTASVIDRVNTTWQVWQGTTFGCVQCHSHPYDPIRHDEYYQFLAFFNNTADADLRDEYPLREVPLDPKEDAEVLRLQREADRAGAKMMRPFQELAAKAEWRYCGGYEVSATKDVQVRVEEPGGVPMAVTEGTLPRGTVFTTVLEDPAGPIHALRVDAPEPPGSDAASPADGFALSYIAAKVTGGEKERDIKLAFVAGDEAEEYLWPLDSLDEKSGEGWGAFPKQHHDRWAVIVPEAAIELAEGERLEVRFDCKLGKDGGNQPVIQRYRLQTSADPAWQGLAASAELADARQARDAALGKLKEIKSTTIPYMRERPQSIARETRVFERGNWMVKGDPVEPALPKLFGSLPEDAPRDRLTLAKWLVSDDNPLAARVIVNHLWGQLFGHGIVTTPGDFGSSGADPTHPELLDYLALTLRDEYHWSLKALLRDITISATYRESAVFTEESRERDPGNLLYARGPRNRMSAEMVRDQALAVSGLLSAKMYGPPVMPPQPDGVWQVARGSDKWKTAEGEDRYRRGLYTFWKRTSPYPSFITFDAPSRQFCTLDRISTNTPLQALVTLNDPVYEECAEALAQRMLAACAQGQLREQIAAGVRLAAGEPATDAELDALAALHADARAAYAAEGKAKDCDQAAMTVVASTILNLDKVLTK